MSEITIRRMTAEDVQAVWAIENATFPTPWSLRDFEHEMRENPCARYLVAVKEDQIIGFAGIHIILDVGHITNIAITQEERGHGVGRMLATALMQYASNLGVSYVTLEVRENNEPAKSLYKSLGFFKVGVRKKYYEGQIDAHVMVTDKMPPPDPDFTEAETAYEDEEEPQNSI